MVIDGVGQAYWETGRSGVSWAVFDADPNKIGYDALYMLEDGDQLTIFDSSDRRIIRWHGTVSFEYDTHIQVSQNNPYYVGQAVHGHWVNGLQRGLDAETWAAYFFEKFPMRLSRLAGWEVFKKYRGENVGQRASLQRLSHGQTVALLSVREIVLPPAGSTQHQYRLERSTTLHLEMADIRDLRDACEAILSVSGH